MFGNQHRKQLLEKISICVIGLFPQVTEIKLLWQLAPVSPVWIYEYLMFASCIFPEPRLWEQFHSVSVFVWAHWETQGGLPAARCCSSCFYGKGCDCVYILPFDNSLWDLWVYCQLQRFTMNIFIVNLLRHWSIFCCLF